MSPRVLLFVGLLGLLAAPAARAQSERVAEPPGAGWEQPVRPGDRVRVRIWREPGLSGTFPVDEEGVVVFPKLGAWTVTGETPESLERRLLDAYRQYLRNPSIDVTVLRRIRIMGAVRRPGLYPIEPTMTIADALALAGGVAPGGEADEVVLRRHGETLEFDISRRSRIGALPIRSGDEIYVPEEGWLGRRVVSALISVGTSLAVTFLVISLRNNSQ